MSGWNQEQEYQAGVRDERERIIKLLESEKFILPEGIDEGLTLMPIQEAIALIKGESVQEPSVSANDGQTDFTDKGENK